MDQDGLIKISEMASLHGISRQTLILYDKNGLLKPAYVNEKGYRYYSLDQIPHLRIICLLKGMGVPLGEIADLLASPDPEAMLGLLGRKRVRIREEIERLARQEEEVDQLAEIFEHMPAKYANEDVPHVVSRPERRAIFSPYPEGEMDVKKLHGALMGAWRGLAEQGIVPSRGFASLLRTESVLAGDPLAGAGSAIVLPRDEEIPGLETIVLPAGDYAVMYKTAMPYDPEPARRLLAWMADRGLRPADVVLDVCLLDTVFYTPEHQEDFCRLEIRCV